MNALLHSSIANLSNKITIFNTKLFTYYTDLTLIAHFGECGKISSMYLVSVLSECVCVFCQKKSHTSSLGVTERIVLMVFSSGAGCKLFLVAEPRSGPREWEVVASGTRGQPEDDAIFVSK